MANWAVVIGIDRYWTPNACLKGAVHDALSMRDWLLDPAGGNVPPENLTLVLAPKDAAPQGTDAAEATTSGIVNAIGSMLKQSGNQGERLYFFYAGHGLTARANQRDENALVCADFTDTMTTNSLALRSLWEFFETLQFQDQFFFVDACRNIPWEDREFEVGRWPLPRKRDPGLPPVQQFILYATSPGLPAGELNEAGNERGAFTDALLEGLRGSGKAKVWSSETQNYQVRWERLVDFVKGELEERRLKVAPGTAQDVLQIPQDAGARGVVGRTRNPVLAEYASDKFPNETLEIVLSPEEVVPVVEVTVLDEVASPVVQRTQLTELPVKVDLPPKTYALHATAPEYDRAVARPPVELYSPCSVPLDLTRAEPVQPQAEAPAADEAAPKSELVIQTKDPLAPIEIADSTGEPLTVSHGTASLSELDPGFYRARLVIPGQETVEEVVEVAPGAERTVELEAPPPSGLVQDLVDRIQAPVRSDNTVKISDTTGPIAAPRLSTILAVTAGAALNRYKHSRKLRQLDLEEVKKARSPKAPASLYVVLGVDSENDAEATSYVRGVSLRLWRIGDPIPEATDSLRPAAKTANVGDFAYSESHPGSYWLSIEPPGGKPMVFAVALLHGRLAMLTLEVGSEGIQVFQYLPSLQPDRSSSPNRLRKIELMERIMLGGELASGYDLARELLDAKLADPLAGCLGAYLYLRLGRAEELEQAVVNLTSRYADVSDVHVIRGEYEAATGDRKAAGKAFAKAVEVGVPIFGEGLTRLLEGLRAYEIEHPLAALLAQVFERHMSGSLWSVWLPERLTPGEHLVP